MKKLTLAERDQNMLIKTGHMTPFGGALENATGSRDTQSATTEQGLQGSVLETETQLDGPNGNQSTRTQKEHQGSLVTSLADDRASNSNNDDDDDDEYLPDDSELKYSWYEDEAEEDEKMEVGKGKKTAATVKRSLNVVYREVDGFKPKKKQKIKKRGKESCTKALDDGSEKVYRQRIR